MLHRFIMRYLLVACLLTISLSFPYLKIPFEAKCRDRTAIGNIWRSKDVCHNPIDDLNVVCGNDGETYLTVWQFNTAQCLNPSLEIDQRGSCLCRHTPKHCASIYAPICGDNGRLYSSVCDFNQAYCSSRVKSIVGFPSTHCQYNCCSPENMIAFPESRGVTSDAFHCIRQFQEQCDDTWMKMGKCLYFSASAAIGEKMLKACGVIGPARCAPKCRPLCASDGIMYPNECVLAWAKGINPYIKRTDCTDPSNPPPPRPPRPAPFNPPSSSYPIPPRHASYSYPPPLRYYENHDDWSMSQSVDSDDTQLCPKGCHYWYNGCNVCECDIKGIVMGCGQKDCKTHNAPKCIMKFTSTPWVDLIQDVGKLIVATKK